MYILKAPLSQKVNRLESWSKNSWQSRVARQQPEYSDSSKFNEVVELLHQAPPLVFSGEVERLKQRLAMAGRGEAFILHGGDCAERFEDCNADAITSKLKILLQMSLILTYGTKKPIVRIGRIAGQYAKPRSKDTEVVDGKEIPSFRGDNVNFFQADANLRMPDPYRLLQGYYSSAVTLNFIRSLISGGFADLHSPEHWNLTLFAHKEVADRYHDVINQIKSAMDFVSSIGADKDHRLRTVDFFTSHEGLLLGYESALTRKVPVRDDYYDLSAHMLWIGDRTRNIDEAHVEFFRGVANPIGVKVGPSSNADEIIEVVKRLNPKNELGKIVLISRFGKDKVRKFLPDIIAKIQKSECNVVWEVDPMHGNTSVTSTGIKTRNFSDVLSEIKDSFEIHNESNSILAGVHFEMTGDDVTECVGGIRDLSEHDLSKNYESYCDPRLNYAQSLEMAFLISSSHK